MDLFNPHFFVVTLALVGLFVIAALLSAPSIAAICHR
jgi:hypothetical protein